MSDIRFIYLGRDRIKFIGETEEGQKWILDNLSAYKTDVDISFVIQSELKDDMILSMTADGLSVEGK